MPLYGPSFRIVAARREPVAVRMLDIVAASEQHPQSESRFVFPPECTMTACRTAGPRPGLRGPAHREEHP